MSRKRVGQDEEETRRIKAEKLEADLEEDTILESPEFKLWTPSNEMMELDKTNHALLLLSQKKGMQTRTIYKLMVHYFGYTEKNERGIKKTPLDTELNRSSVSRRLRHAGVAKEFDRFSLAVEPRCGLQAILPYLKKDAACWERVNTSNLNGVFDFSLDCVMAALLYRDIENIEFIGKRPFIGKQISSWTLIQFALGKLEDAEELEHEKAHGVPSGLPRTTVPLKLLSDPTKRFFFQTKKAMDDGIEVLDVVLAPPRRRNARVQPVLVRSPTPPAHPPQPAIVKREPVDEDEEEEEVDVVSIDDDVVLPTPPRRDASSSSAVVSNDAASGSNEKISRTSAPMQSFSIRDILDVPFREAEQGPSAPSVIHRAPPLQQPVQYMNNSQMPVPTLHQLYGAAFTTPQPPTFPYTWHNMVQVQMIQPDLNGVPFAQSGAANFFSSFAGAGVASVPHLTFNAVQQLSIQELVSLELFLSRLSFEDSVMRLRQAYPELFTVECCRQIEEIRQSIQRQP